ncbi:D-glycero-beta-D-manno-heptose 1-phosphate adenylyltransferase [Phenylobacterium montanum]|uniref:D-glycero-beta-D-manno-heptose 1-phosphate adenylyltransferase n=1 Tax=Phenylobacterium montanum TaxID=2823693 RepID=UPI0035E40637
MIDRFSDRVLVVIGDVMLDRFVYGRADRVSPEAPALVLRVEDDRWLLGGAANVAANIAELGGKAILIGRVGVDDDAQIIRRLADQTGGGLGLRLVEDCEAPTTVKTRYLAGDRHLLRADREKIGLSSKCEAELIRTVEAAIHDADAIVVSDYAKGVVSDAVLSAVFKAADSGRKPVIVDPKRRDLRAYRGATVITPNRGELSLSTGVACDDEQGAARAAEIAIEQTGATVLLTRSEQGVSLYRPGLEAWRDMARAKTIRDVSGAGDTVVATLALALASGADMTAAAHLSNVAAGVAVSKSGTSLVSPEELRLALLGTEHGTDSGCAKRLPLKRVIEQRARWREEGVKVGFTNGCFDLIHPGHVRLLREAKRHCDKLIVAINSDSSVQRLNKGPSRPIQNENARLEVMAALEPVDIVLMFSEDTPYDLIADLEPDILIKGADYTEDRVVGAALVKARGGRVVLVDIAKGHSTTNLVARSAPSSDAA